MSSSESGRPIDAIGGACNQSPECGDEAALSRATSISETADARTNQGLIIIIIIIILHYIIIFNVITSIC